MLLEQLLFKVNLFWLFWFTATSIILVLGLIILYFPHLLSQSLINFYLFGKLRSKKDESKTKANFLEFMVLTLNINVPKSYFSHFYGFAVIITALVFLVYFFAPSNIVDWSRLFVDLLLGRGNGTIGLNSNAAIVVFSLSICHLFRRLYESVYISVSAQTMGIFHYFFGLLFYVSFNLQLLNLMLPTKDSLEDEFDVWKVTLGTALFVFGSYFQNQSLRILRSLRTGKNGEVLEKLLRKHQIPVGSLFNYISCPHYFCEIIIYVALFLVSNCHTSWIPLIYWVISCHIVNGLLTHRWYQNQFSDYPSQRKAIIPFIL